MIDFDVGEYFIEIKLIGVVDFGSSVGLVIVYVLFKKLSKS